MPKRKSVKKEDLSSLKPGGGSNELSSAFLNPCSASLTNSKSLADAVESPSSPASANPDAAEATSISASESTASTINDGDKVLGFDDEGIVRELTPVVRSPQFFTYPRTKTLTENVIDNAAYSLLKTREVLGPMIASGATVAAQHITTGVEKALPIVQKGVSLAVENISLATAASIDTAIPLIAKGAAAAAENLTIAASVARDAALRAVIYGGEMAKVKLQELEGHHRLTEQATQPKAR